jgi:hypothetical protein
MRWRRAMRRDQDIGRKAAVAGGFLTFNKLPLECGE